MEFTKTDLNKTVYVKEKDLEKGRKWNIIDAQWIILWRMASQIASKLMWKDKAYYCDFWDTGDYVVVLNAGKIAVTGKKLEQKIYYRHSGYKGHLKQVTLWELLIKKPEKALWFAVRWMLPKNKLRDVRMKRLKIFTTDTHPYNNLSLQPLQIND